MVDGGSLARDLKDYARIDSLLKRCSITKLLGFLQQYPEVFQVNREVLPHTVYLLSNGCVNISRGEEKEAYSYSSISLEIEISHVKEHLKDRVICVRKKDASKDARRDRAESIQVSTFYDY